MTVPLSLPKQTQLREYIPREPIPYELATDDEIINGAGGILICDTETYINYHLIQFRDIRTKKVIQLELPGAFNASKLSWIMHSYCVVGFNIIKYDSPVVWCAHAFGDLEIINRVSQAVVYNNTWPQQLEKDYHFSIHKTNIIDMIEVCPGMHSLKLYMARLHSQRIQDLPFSPHKPITPEQIEIVKNYCLNDIVG